MTQDVIVVTKRRPARNRFGMWCKLMEGVGSLGARIVSALRKTLSFSIPVLPRWGLVLLRASEARTEKHHQRHRRANFTPPRRELLPRRGSPEPQRAVCLKRCYNGPPPSSPPSSPLPSSLHLGLSSVSLLWRRGPKEAARQLTTCRG